MTRTSCAWRFLTVALTAMGGMVLASAGEALACSAQTSSMGCCLVGPDPGCHCCPEPSRDGPTPIEVTTTEPPPAPLPAGASSDSGTPADRQPPRTGLPRRGGTCECRSHHPAAPRPRPDHRGAENRSRSVSPSVEPPILDHPLLAHPIAMSWTAHPPPGPPRSPLYVRIARLLF